ncbi:hypothetical protein [Marinobacter aromaticivorans]|jgi:hypothetical protein|uniref:Uncharacterized protein n=2 Tax=Marinobacter TaxID=2742 RepID=A0ABW2IYU8_9GAMM|nr:hypothetical protein [Marinobacter aromaticivorans]
MPITSTYLLKANLPVTDQQQKLLPFTLRLKEDDHTLMKLLAAIDDTIEFQYELLDAAVSWAHANRMTLHPVAVQKGGVKKSFYVGNSASLLADLERSWNCNPTRAVHTALFHYLRYQSQERNLLPATAG